jgi:cytochrome c peroxidase
MKAIIAFSLAFPAVTTLAQNGTIDLTQPPNYANQSVPAYISEDNTPGVNPVTDLGATLGRTLFYDKRLSRSDTIACASCHQQEHAFSDLATASVGVAGTTGRHSTRLINARFAEEVRFFWDERAASLEAQTTQPIQDHVEMGFSGTNGDPGFSDLVAKLSPIREYQALFAIVYGDPTITEARIQNAIAQFVRSIQSFDSKYDQGRAVAANNTANFPNFTTQENNGKRLFHLRRQDGGANCATCHRAPEFDIDPDSDNNGVIGALSGGTDLTVTRSPSLRDLVKADGSSNGAFMHNASLASLLDVVNHYNAIPTDNNNLDRRLRPGGQPQNLNLTESEKNDLVAFMRTLTGVAVYTNPKWSNPFNENGELTLIILPPDNTAVVYSGAGESRMATVSTSGVAGLEYACETSTDLRVWTSQSVPATAQGELSAAFASPASAPKQFFRFVYRVPELLLERTPNGENIL